MRALALAARIVLAVGAIATAPRLAAQRGLEPNSVQGTARDARGRPLAGVQVHIKRDFTYGSSRTTTDADGRYAVRQLVSGTFRAFAYVSVPYGGATVCQRLHPAPGEDDNSFAADRGVMRSFVWRSTGTIGNASTAVGGSIRLVNAYLLRESSRTVELQLTPHGPLLDGTAGASITRQIDFQARASRDGITDIPIGTYSLRATRITSDGRREPLSIATAPGGPYATEVPLVWRSTGRCGLGPDSGVEPAGVWIEVPRRG